MGTCQGSAAQDFQTFDGLLVDIQDSCTYTIAKYCGSDSTLVPFSLEEKSSNVNSQDAAKMQLSHLKVYGYTVTINKGESVQLMVRIQVLWVISIYNYIVGVVRETTLEFVIWIYSLIIKKLVIWVPESRDPGTSK